MNSEDDSFKTTKDNNSTTKTITTESENVNGSNPNSLKDEYATKSARNTRVMKKIKSTGKFNSVLGAVEEDFKQSIGRVIKLHRKIMKLTQSELAKELGVSQTTINQWEIGKYLPSLSVSKVLCDVFNIEPNYLFGTTDINNKAFSLSDLNAQARQLITRINMLDDETKSLVLQLLDIVHVGKLRIF